MDFALPETEAVAVIGYTSGTTGRSKGAMLTHRNLASNAAAVTTAWHWTAADRLLLTLPLFHAHGLFGTVRACGTGEDRANLGIVFGKFGVVPTGDPVR